jgi:GNAT superfamily N-acetyltransferase
VTLELRPFGIADLPGIYRVCAEVDGVGEGTPPSLRVPELAGHVYAGPYAVADPELSFVLVDELGVAGYLVATADAAAFERWRDEHWSPALRAQFPLPDRAGDDSADHRYLKELHRPPGSPDPQTIDAPAQLHMKLTERARQRGHGRALVEALEVRLRARRVPGIHVGVAATNWGAIAFYERLGFRIAVRHPWGSTLVRDLGEAV